MDVVSDADVEAVEAVDDVFLTQGAVGEDTSIQRFVIDPGAEVPEHDHPHEQIGAVTEGALTFVVDGEELVVEAGDTYSIPGGEPHGARNDGDETVVGYDIFSPPRANPDWQESVTHD
ncbi:cupin domain-containing protein [Halorubrum sp. Hd13]|uniref:cupin domain-containing protein n=1 Tax=Halorubrum sp. Hd13 TaxID=1480728 RepID=UPI000B98B03E|nr:cupin domain-containing protein [Halorubrum sp. Hd13]OYR46408.1 cupin [Halorubrum sp. Hd13]